MRTMACMVLVERVLVERVLAERVVAGMVRLLSQGLSCCSGCPNRHVRKTP